MAIERHAGESTTVRAPARARAHGLRGGATTGNERLTAATGAVLIVLLAVIGVTIISLSRLLWVHLFVGMLLLGPLALKLGSTGYRFVRYYTANRSYREKGPPPTPLRLLAPIVVLSTLTVFASGVALLFIGPNSRGTLLPIHKISFFIWVAFMAIHVLAHLPTVARALRADYVDPAVGGRRTPGRNGRALSLISALVGGVVIAILVIPQFAPWISSHHFHH
jgi:hypothetical protein